MRYLMGQGEKQMLHLHQGSCMVGLQDHSNHHKQYAKHGDQEDQWMMIMEQDDHQDTCNNDKNNIPSSLSSSFEDTSTSSNGSLSSSSPISSSSDLDDDDDDDGDDDTSSTSSSSHSPSSSNTNGPLYELSDLMAQLPIKRGLSKFYQGKSQSYTSLSRVMSLEDLAKKEIPYRKKMKSCKSYGGGLDAHKSYTLPKATIAKKVSRGSSFSSLSFTGRKSTFLGSCRPPPVPVQKHF